MEEDYYALLGVAKNASDSEIKKAYRKIAIKYHPDKNQGNAAAEDTFKKATEAYEVLSNSEKRNIYDKYGHAGIKGAAQGGSAQDFSGVFREFSDIFGGSSFEGFFSGGFDELFGFGRSRSGGRGQRESQSADVHLILTISLEESVKGTEKEFSFSRKIRCSRCEGTGSEAKQGRTTCPTCGGRGSVSRSNLGGFFSISSTCSSCGGTGEVIRNPCRLCKGQGFESRKPKIKLKIPRGINANETLSLASQGNELGNRKGTLYVTIDIAEDQYYVRDGKNLYTTVSVDWLNAYQGASYVFSHIDGRDIPIDIPPRTEYGDRIKISREGVRSDSSYSGDLYLHIMLLHPKGLDKRVLEQLAMQGGVQKKLKPIRRQQR